LRSNSLAHLSANPPVSLPRNLQRWFPGYLEWRLGHRRLQATAGTTTDILFCLADHFEPEHGDPGVSVERRRVAAWLDRYPRSVEGIQDSDGCPPRHTFFCSAEAYRAEHFAALGELCHAGLGEVEVHLHHHDDTSANLRRALGTFRDRLHGDHGLLSVDRDGNTRYAFIHGNWTLDNSGWRGRRCGVNDEISVLLETGCYADLTMPAAPNYSQTRTVNSIYYAIDDPARPRSHDRGIRARARTAPPDDGLLMIQGPLRFNWRARAHGVLPRLENGAIAWWNPPSVERFTLWTSTAVHVAERPEWVFVKVYTHGAIERNADVLLGDAMRRFHEEVGATYNDGRRFRLHYVTAREAANIAMAAVAGHSGNPGRFRSFAFTALGEAVARRA
jgi:hypothetical protein